MCTTEFPAGVGASGVRSCGQNTVSGECEDGLGLSDQNGRVEGVA